MTSHGAGGEREWLISVVAQAENHGCLLPRNPDSILNNTCQMCASQVEDHSAETGHWIYTPHLPPLKVSLGLDYGIDVSGGVRDCQSEVENVCLKGLHHVKVTVAGRPFLPRVPRVTLGGGKFGQELLSVCLLVGL